MKQGRENEMNLFTCDSICTKCTENDCPFRYDEDFQETLAYHQRRSLAQSIIINSTGIIDLIQKSGHSLFNVINAWIYTDPNISEKEIRRYLIIFMPEHFVRDMPTEFDDLFQSVMSGIVYRIQNVIRDKCDKNECSYCEIGECCPVSRKNATHH